MTELLAREKEYIKLNEKLDKLATSALEDSNPHQPHNAAHSPKGAPRHGGESRYHTYTKIKGPSTLQKRRVGDIRAAGDCSTSDGMSEVSTGTLKSRVYRTSGTPHTSDYGHGRQAHAGKIHHTIKATTAAATTVRSTRTHDDDDVSFSHNNRKDGGVPNLSSTAPASHRKSIKSHDSSSRTHSRTSNRSNASTATFTVKYRNPKFVESPSLEVLVKDETASIRQLNEPPRIAPANKESVTSMSVDGNSRRSEATNSKQVSADGLIKFLKSKISLLEEDHERLSVEMSQQKELLDKTLERHKKSEQQRDQAYSKNNSLTEQLTKVESQLEEANRRIKERIIEHSSHQKDLEATRRELKMLTQTNTNLEKRLYRANEDLENTKNALTLMKSSERDIKETIRVENEGKDKQIKSLKKQRADLLNAYKKQLYLIENLKKQNFCMEQSKIINFGEKEFTKVLEWNTKD